MLHAEIHGKTPSEADTEDILTSSVFGTLFLTRADGVVRDWLQRARTPTGELLRIPDGAVRWYAFWPRLEWSGGDSIPDLLVQIGDVLVIVEAKDYSGASSANQLAREWEACTKTAPSYAADVRRALESSPTRVLVYLVRRMSHHKELRYVEECIAETKSPIYVLNWEDLHGVLRDESEPPRWNVELTELLRRRSLTGFNGFAKAFAGIARERFPMLSHWHSPRHRVTRWSTIVRPNELAGISALAAWRPQFASHGGSDE